MPKLVLACVALAVAVAGVLAATGAASAPAPSHPAQVAQLFEKKAPPKCVKYAKKHGKKVCIKRAKPKPKPKPKPVPTPSGDGDGGGTTTTQVSLDGSYTGVSAQNASVQFDLSGDTLGTLTLGEIDTTCTPGGWENALYGSFSVGESLDASGKLHASIPVTTTSGSTGTLVVDITADASGKATGALSLTLTVGGTGGPYSCTSGAVTLTAGTGASAPAAPQHAKPGHYVGTTAQGAAFVFDVAASGTILLMNNLTFPELDEDCDPGQVPIAIKNFHFSNFLVDAAGNLRILYQTASPDFTETFAILGSIDASGHASGTINDKAAFPYGGTNWSCASGSVSWTASLQ
jgi:hypothetical protein